MAYASNTLVNISGGPPGSSVYHHDAGDDTMATVAAAGYFNNTDDNLNLAVDDMIVSTCSDGDMMLKVSAVSSGSVTTQRVGNEGEWNGAFGSASVTIGYGVSELTGTATNFLLPAPYPGAKVTVIKSGTADASAVFVTDATSTTLDAAGDRNIGVDAQYENFSLLGVSTSRWVVVGGSGFFTS
jgi:hypothetical protein